VRLWVLLAGLAAVVLATADGSRLAEAGAGVLLILFVLLLARLDNLQGRRRTRR
jgi:hypothetical protein